MCQVAACSTNTTISMLNKSTHTAGFQKSLFGSNLSKTYFLCRKLELYVKRCSIDFQKYHLLSTDLSTFTLCRKQDECCPMTKSYLHQAIFLTENWLMFQVSQSLFFLANSLDIGTTLCAKGLAFRRNKL